MLPIRYGRMLKSPFAFFRVAAAVMASDLAHTPITGMRPGLWRLPHHELRRIRYAGAKPDLRHQRL